MYYKKCGKKIEDDSIFCRYCGAHHGEKEGKNTIDLAKQPLPVHDETMGRDKETIAQNESSYHHHNVNSAAQNMKKLGVPGWFCSLLLILGIGITHISPNTRKEFVQNIKQIISHAKQAVFPVKGYNSSDELAVIAAKELVSQNVASPSSIRWKKGRNYREGFLRPVYGRCCF